MDEDDDEDTTDAILVTPDENPPEEFPEPVMSPSGISRSKDKVAGDSSAEAMPSDIPQTCSDKDISQTVQSDSQCSS